MKIVFNMKCGLGNNGGTRTVLLCQEELKRQNHTCKVLSNSDNFTWFKHDKVINKTPDNMDVMIATASTTVKSAMKTSAKLKVWYIRGHETWVKSEKELSKLYNSGILNIVNSYGLQKLLKDKFGAESYVVHQGVDLDSWPDKNSRGSEKIRIGCLKGTEKTKRWDDFVKLSKILGPEKYEYVAFGSIGCDDKFLLSYLKNPSHEELTELYSSCHIWFAPTELEGLHNVPMEAALCGCLVVCNNAPLNGMTYDYALPNTAMIYDEGDIPMAAKLIQEPKWELIKNMQEYITSKIGSRESNMKKLLEYIDEKMLEESKKRKILAAGPWVGEFGWELFAWQPYLRHLASTGKYEEIIVSSRESSRFLYEDFCTKFIPYETSLQNCSFSSSSDRKSINAKEVFEGEEYSKILVPTHSGIADTKREFINFGDYDGDLAYDVVIHARNIGPKGSSYKRSRNWEKEKWKELGQILQSKGLRVCSIGVSSAAVHVTDTEDKRDCNLSELADILASSKLCIGPSSGPMHFASLCKCRHIVWTEPKNINRYRKKWNPFNTPVRLILDGGGNGWNPKVNTVVDAILEELS